MPPHQRSRHVKPPKDERTKFDKWLDQSIVDKRVVWFVLYDSEEISCRPVVTDRYMVQVDIADNGDEPDLVWINKGAILKAAHSSTEDDE